MPALLAIALLQLADEDARSTRLMPSPDVLPRPRFPEPLPLPPPELPPAVRRDEPAPNPMRVRAAGGSASGHWGYAETGLAVGATTFVDPRNSADWSIQSFFVGGWGFQRGGVRIVPSAAIAWTLLGPVSPVGLRVAAPELLMEKRTRLRLTPVAGLTIPTVPAPNLLSVVSLGLQLERRFGPVEVAYRSEAGRTVSARVATETWLLLNRLLVEAWLRPWVSAAIGLALLSGWPERAAAAAALPFLFTTTAQINLALDRRVGLSFSVDSAMPATDAMGQPVFALSSIATTLSLRVWVRSDERIQRNWLDR